MYAIDVVGHGEFAKGLLSSVKVILGEQRFAEGVEFAESDSSEMLRDKIMDKIEGMKGADGVIFLTDLAGGTPFKTCVLMSQDIKNSRVLAGTNLPLLIEILMNRELEDVDAIVNNGISTGRDSIILYKTKPRNKTNIKKGNGI